nr:homologous-pairing protein 2 homolog [Tanacetum cinerariifolium]
MEILLEPTSNKIMVIADFLQKFNLKKTAIQKALDSLAESGNITFKEYAANSVASSAFGHIIGTQKPAKKLESRIQELESQHKQIPSRFKKIVEAIYKYHEELKRLRKEQSDVRKKLKDSKFMDDVVIDNDHIGK